MAKVQIHELVQSYLTKPRDLPTPNRNLANFYRSYFLGAYFLFISPFRLKLVHSRDGIPCTPYFKSVGWLPQKIVCLTLLFLHLFWMARDIKVSLPKDAKNPSMYFLMIHTVVSATWKLVTLKYFWFNRADLVKVVNFVVDEENNVPVVNSRKSSSSSFKPKSNLILVGVILLIYSGVGVGYWVAGKGVLAFSNKVEGWSPGWWWRTMKLTGRVIFFHNNNSSQSQNSTMSSVLGALAIGSAYHRRVLPAYCYYFGLVTVLTLRFSAVAFSSAFTGVASTLGMEGKWKEAVFKINGTGHNSIGMGNKQIVIDMKEESREPLRWPEIRRQYWALKTLASLMNQTVGTYFTLFLVKSIVYYAITFDEVFLDAKPKWGKIILLSLYFTNACCVLYFSADICYQMSKFKEWLLLQSNRQKMSSDELFATLNELDCNVVAIRGGNVFPITHSLVANIVGVTVTYFIICVQG